MAEEFQESEVIFADYNDDHDHDHDDIINLNYNESDSDYSRESKRKKITNCPSHEKLKISMPVSIPENVRRSSWFRYTDDDGDDGGEMVPPHVIVGRRVAGKVMAFSVCTGNGRTLKGRDLSEVRNSILRMTGFLET